MEPTGTGGLVDRSQSPGKHSYNLYTVPWIYSLCFCHIYGSKPIDWSNHHPAVWPVASQNWMLTGGFSTSNWYVSLQNDKSSTNRKFHCKPSILGYPPCRNGWPSTSNRSSILQPWPRFHRNNQPWLSASTTNIGRPLATMPGKKSVIDWLQVDSKSMMGDEFMLQPIDEATSSTYGWIWYVILYTYNYIIICYDYDTWYEQHHMYDSYM